MVESQKQMKWEDALRKVNFRLTQVALYGKGKVEIHITPRNLSLLSVSVLAGENSEYEIDRSSINEED